jgi:hypothetical protein
MVLRAATITAILAGVIGVFISLAQLIDFSADNPAAVDPRPTISPSPPTAVSPGQSPVAVQRVEIVVIPGQPQASDDGTDRVSQIALLTTAMGTLLAGIGALGALTAARRRPPPAPREPGKDEGEANDAH